MSEVQDSRLMKVLSGEEELELSFDDILLEKYEWLRGAFEALGLSCRVTGDSNGLFFLESGMFRLTIIPGEPVLLSPTPEWVEDPDREEEGSYTFTEENDFLVLQTELSVEDALEEDPEEIPLDEDSEEIPEETLEEIPAEESDDDPAAESEDSPAAESEEIPAETPEAKIARRAAAFNLRSELLYASYDAGDDRILFRQVFPFAAFANSSDQVEYLRFVLSSFADEFARF